MAKPILRSGFTFTPASKQINFSGVSGFNINGLLAIFNRTAGVQIFDATDPTLDFSAVSGSRVTLKYDTTGQSASDVLTIVYDEQAQDALFLPIAVTSTGIKPGISTAGFASCVLDIVSATNIQVVLEGSVDSTDGLTGTWQPIKGFLTNLAENAGDTNNNQGLPYNRRYFELHGVRWIRLNVSSMAAGGSPVVNLLLRTFSAPHHQVMIAGGNVVANFDSGGSVGYVRTSNLYQEVLQGALAANARLTGSSRQVYGYPNPYYPRFGASVISDQACKVQFQFSMNNTDWITFATSQVEAGVPFEDDIRVIGQWHRIVVINDGVANAAKGLSAFTYYTL